MMEDSKPTKQRVQLIPGIRFGKLTTIEIFEKNKNKSYVWICQCDCGNKTKAITAELNRGKVKSCGCLKLINGKNNQNWRGFKDISGNSWYKIKNGANKRNIDFNITIEQAWKLFENQDGKCYLSGLDLAFNKTSSDGLKTASLDRLDSSKGYEIDNIAWANKYINKIKYTFSVNEFINYCNLITNFDGIFKESFYNFFINNEYICSIKHNSKKRNFIYELSNEQLIKKFNDQGCVCALTGLNLIFPDSKYKFKEYKHTASLDRINNNLGYTLDNVQWIHKDINRSKMNYNIERYKELCKLVTNHNTKTL